MALQSAFLAEGSVLLILLASAILLYRSFRERYLVPWIFGWTVFGLSRFFAAVSASEPLSHAWLICAYASYAAAIWLFATAVFYYANQKELLWPAGLTLGGGLGVVVLHVLVFPKSAFLGTVFYLSWRLVLVIVAVLLVRFAWGRLAVGRWLLAALLLMLHLDLRTADHTIAGQDILLDLLLGISMVTIVLDGASLQIRRLGVLNRITQKISDSAEFGPTVGTALAELMEVSGAKAAWFRALEGDKLV